MFTRKEILANIRELRQSVECAFFCLNKGAEVHFLARHTPK